MLGLSRIGSVMWTLRLAFCVGIFQGTAADDGERYDEVFSVSEAFQPTKSSVLTYIDIVDEMHFEMDITLNSFPSGWASIFHCSTENYPRLPGIWIHPSSASGMGFHVKWSNADNINYGPNTGETLVAGDTYHLEIDIAQGSMKVTVNGVVKHEATGLATHSRYDDLVCYASDPWYDAADVAISNLFIGVPGSPTVEPSKEPTTMPTEQPTAIPSKQPTMEPTAQPSAEPTQEPSRDCSVFHIDEFLMDCSVEFDAHDAHIDTLKSDVASMKDELSGHELDVADLMDTVSQLVNATTTMAASIDSINAEMQIIIESLDRMGDYP